MESEITEKLNLLLKQLSEEKLKAESLGLKVEIFIPNELSVSKTPLVKVYKEIIL
jgi:hypothetical protein